MSKDTQLLLSEALEAVKNRKLIDEVKLSLRKVLSCADLPQGYFAMVADKICEVTTNQNLVVISGKEIDLHLDEHTLSEVESILENYIGDAVKGYIFGVHWHNKAIQAMNEVLKAIRQSKTKEVKGYLKTLKSYEAELYAPVIKAELQSRTVSGKISYVARKILEKVRRSFGVLLASGVVRGFLKEA